MRTRRWSDMTLDEMREMQRRELTASAAAPAPAAAAAALSASSVLEPWQERRLAMAHAEGRRRVAVNDLAASLGLDRRACIDWWQAFPARPKEQREALLRAAGEERARMSAE